jgi:hypothetical protein
MAVSLANCSGIQTGATTIPKLSTGCMFLTGLPINSGKQIQVEFIGNCPNYTGPIDPLNPTLNGPYKIVLLKTPGGSDS